MRSVELGEGTWTYGSSTGAENNLLHSETSGFERLLLLATIVVLPLEDHIPAVMGFSSLFIMFAVLAAYVLINRLQALDRIWLHPVFMASYTFLGISLLVEFASPVPNYALSVRFFFTVCGAVFVAALCRDRPALTACFYGYIGAAVWLGVLIVMTSYGTLGGMAATDDFDQASRVRLQAFKDMPVHANLNNMSFSCSQGAVIALALTLGAASSRRRNFLLFIAVFCFVASCFAMSRGGIAIAILSGATVLYAGGIKQLKEFIIIGCLAGAVFFLVPDAIWSRMTFSTEEDKTDSRGLIYIVALQHLSEFLFTGVGAGSCPEKLILEHWSCVVHNSFLQVVINWGLIGLVSFITIIWAAYRCLPKGGQRDVLALAVIGVAMSLFLEAFFISEFFYKGFSVGLGMLVASRSWLWPNGSPVV